MRRSLQVERSHAEAQTVTPTKTADLTKRDWLIAGRKRLAQGGLKALRLRTLTTDLGVSTGSFYHHFADVRAYENALAEYISGEHVAGVLAEADQSPTPMGKIESLVAIAARDSLSALALAMRAWADSDESARIAVRRHDAVVLEYLTHVLLQMDFPAGEARVRAYALAAVGLGSIDGTNGLTPDQLKRGLLNLLCGRPRLSSAIKD